MFPRATISLFRERTYTIQPHLETKRKIETVECKENQTRKQVTRTNNDSDQKAGESDSQKPKINAIFSHRLEIKEQKERELLLIGGKHRVTTNLQRISNQKP